LGTSTHSRKKGKEGRARATSFVGSVSYGKKEPQSWSQGGGEKTARTQCWGGERITWERGKTQFLKEGTLPMGHPYLLLRESSNGCFREEREDVNASKREGKSFLSSDSFESRRGGKSHLHQRGGHGVYAELGQGNNLILSKRPAGTVYYKSSWGWEGGGEEN